MAGEVILNKLQKHKFDDLDTQIREYLTPVFYPKFDGSRSKHSYFALKFLHSYVSLFEKLAICQGTAAVGVALTCHSALKLRPLDLKEPLTVEKFLYHLLNKALKACFYPEAVEIADALFSDLSSASSDGVSNLAYCSYVALWNAALQQEQASATTDCSLSFRLRQVAIKMLLLSNKPVSLILERLAVTQDKFERETAAGRSSCKAEMTEMLCGLYSELISHLRVSLGSANSSPGYMAAYIELHVRYFKLLLALDSSKCTKLISELNGDLDRHVQCNSQGKHVTSAWKLAVKYMEVIIEIRTAVNNKTTKDVPKKVLQILHQSNEIHSAFSCCSAFPAEELCLLNNCGLLCNQHSCELLAKMKSLPVCKTYELFHECVVELLNNIALTLSLEERLLSQSSCGDDKQKRLQLIRTEYGRLKLQRFKGFLSKVQELKDFSSSSSKALLERSHGEMSEYRQWLDRHIPQTLTPEELLQLEVLLYRFSRACYHKTEYKAVVAFLGQSVAALKKWITVARPSPEKVSEYQVWKRYEILADSQRRRGKLTEAMTAVTEGLLADIAQLTGAADMWLRIKAEMVKNKTRPQELAKTLWSTVASSGLSLTEADVLTAEFKAAKATRWKSHAQQLVVVEELLKSCHDDRERVAWLLEKTSILWAARLDEDCVAEACCDEALSLLEEICSKKKPEPSSRDSLARAYLWKHLLQDVDLTEIKQKMSAYSRNVEIQDNASSDTEDPATFQDCVTIEMENEAFNMADSALDVWESLVEDVGHVQCVQSTLDGVGVLAAVYRLAQKTLHELRALSLLSRMTSAVNNDQRHLHVQTQLLEFYCRLKQPNMAAHVVMTTEEWLNQRQKLREGHGYIWYLVARAKLAFISAQIPEGLQLLQQAMTLKSTLLNNRTKDAMLLDASLRQLQASYCRLPPDLMGDIEVTGESSVELQVAGMRSLSGVIVFLMGDWVVSSNTTSEAADDKVPDNTLDMWSTLSSLLDALLETSSLFVELGEAREARCILHQGLNISQAFSLPRRFANFHVALGRLDALSGRYNDASAHIHTANYVLKQATPQKQPTKKYKSRKSKDRNSAFGFDSDDDDIIQTRNLGEETPTRRADSPRGCDSPGLRHEGPETPPHWKHSGSCDCVWCTDILSEKLRLITLALEGEKLRLEGAGGAADPYWHCLLRHMEQLTERAQRHLQGSTVVTNKPSSVYEDAPAGEAVSSMYQDVLVDVCLGMAEYGLYSENWELYEQWGGKALQLLDVETYPWMVGCQARLAQALYLQAIPALMPEALEQVSPVDTVHNDGLSDQISKLRICEPPKLNIVPQTPANPTQPPKARARGKANAPKKNARNTKKASPDSTIGNLNTSSSLDESNCGAHDESDLQTPAATTAEALTKKASRSKICSRNSLLGETIIEEDNAESKPGVRPSVTMTATKKLKGKVLEMPSSPAPTDDTLNFPLSFKTPHNVNSRRAALDLLMNSNSDEDRKIAKSVRKPKTANAVKKSQTVGGGGRGKAKNDSVLSCLSPSINNERVKSVALERNLLLDKNNRIKTPSKTLFKLVASKENAYEFDLSDGDEIIAPKTRPKSKKVGNRRKNDTTLVSKHEQQSGGIAIHGDVKSAELKPIRSKKNTKSSVSVKPAGRGRLTRAKTGSTEDNRDDSEEEIGDFALDVSLYMPDGESEDEPSLLQDNDTVFSPLNLGQPSLAKSVKFDNDIIIADDVIPMDLPQCSPIEMARREVDQKLRRRVSDIEYSEIDEAEAMYLDDGYVDEDSYGEHSSLSILDIYANTPDKEEANQAAVHVGQNGEECSTTTLLPILTYMEETMQGQDNGHNNSTRMPFPDLQYAQSPIQHSLLSAAHDVDYAGLLESALSISRIRNVNSQELSDLEEEPHSPVTSESSDNHVSPLLDLCAAIDEHLSDTTSPSFDNLEPWLRDIKHSSSKLEPYSEESRTCIRERNKSGSGTDTERTTKSSNHQQKRIKYDDPIETFRAGSDDETKLKPKRTARKPRAKTTKVTKSKEEGSDAELPRASQPQIRFNVEHSSLPTEPMLIGNKGNGQDTKADAKEALGHLERAFKLLRHQPSSGPYRDVCQSLGLAALSQDPWKAAYYFTEGHAVTFRYQALLNITRKLRKMEKDEPGGVDSITRDLANIGLSVEAQRASLSQMKSHLTFNKTVADLQEMVKGFPKDVVVCQVSVTTPPSHHGNQMVVTRFLNNKPPVVIPCPGFATKQGQQVLSDFQSVLNSSRDTMALKDKVEWWMKRADLDEQLQDLLSNLEHHWLGTWRGVLQGLPENEDDCAALSQAAVELHNTVAKVSRRDVTPEQLEVLLSCGHKLRTEDLVATFHHITDLDLESDDLENLVLTFQRRCKQLNLEGSQRKPVCLLLDKEVQHLPWESIPVLHGQPVTRMPSAHYLRASFEAISKNKASVVNRGVDPRSTFYVLNPESNLPVTQETFQSWFKKEPGWQGVISQPPSTEQYKEAVSNHDLFIYCGHGSGRKFFSGESTQSQLCRAVVLLMGCSSGKLTAEGKLEAAGLMLNYYLAGCPCVVANLWDVTDRDIDRYLEELLQRWLISTPAPSLINAVHQSRSKCRLPYLIGAAPVVYGLPMHIHRTRTITGRDKKS